MMGWGNTACQEVRATMIRGEGRERFRLEGSRDSRGGRQNVLVGCDIDGVQMLRHHEPRLPDPVLIHFHRSHCAETVNGLEVE